jgi:hypothetical protein
MKNRQSARPGRRQKPSVEHARRPANRLSATGSFQCPSAATIHAVGLGAAQAALPPVTVGREARTRVSLFETSRSCCIDGGCQSHGTNSRFENSDRSLRTARIPCRGARAVSRISLAVQLHRVFLNSGTRAVCWIDPGKTFAV